MSDDRLVELTAAHNPFEAELIVGSLKGLGIHAVSVGDSLSDEFAMSQQLMGLSGGIQVLVPTSQLEEAREALRDIEAARAEQAAAVDLATEGTGDEEEDSDEDDDRGNATRWILTLGLACVVLAGLCLYLWSELRKVSPGDPNFEFEWTDDGFVERWRDNGKRARSGQDRDRNGVYERFDLYDRAGVLTWRELDVDQDGVYERRQMFDRNVEERVRFLDQDENGRYERMEASHGPDRLERWYDDEEDGYFERCEMIDRSSGTVLWSGRIDPENGWVANPR